MKSEKGFTVHDDMRAGFEPIEEHCTRQDLILVTGGIQCANCGAMVVDHEGD
jgi:hypothetical protein